MLRVYCDVGNQLENAAEDSRFIRMHYDVGNLYGNAAEDASAL